MAGVEGWEQVGTRVREARLAAGLSQGALAVDLGIDRSAVVRMESGQRQVSALELFRLSEVLGVPVAHFVSAPPAAIVSLRTDLDEDAQELARDRYRVDAALEAHGRDAEFLRERGYLPAGLRIEPREVTSVDEARRFAVEVRQAAGYAAAPLPSMSAVSDLFGLYILITDLLGEGASLRLDDRFGVAVVSGRAPAGRRRFTAAHELGHHLLGDEYQSDVGVAASRDERERLIDAFAAELLLPAGAITSRWESAEGVVRSRLIGLAAEYRVSWGVAVQAALRCGRITAEEARLARSQTPQRGEFLAVCGNEPAEDLNIGQTGPVWRRAVLAAYADGVFTPARAIELLHGAIGESDLPDRDVRPTP